MEGLMCLSYRTKSNSVRLPLTVHGRQSLYENPKKIQFQPLHFSSISPLTSWHNSHNFLYRVPWDEVESSFSCLQNYFITLRNRNLLEIIFSLAQDTGLTCRALAGATCMDNEIYLAVWCDLIVYVASHHTTRWWRSERDWLNFQYFSLTQCVMCWLSVIL